MVDWFGCDDEKARALWNQQKNPAVDSNSSRTIYNSVRNGVSMFWLGNTVSEGVWKMPENGSPLAGIPSLRFCFPFLALSLSKGGMLCNVINISNYNA